MNTLGIDSPERAVPSMCITQARVYLDRRITQVFGHPIEYRRQGCSSFGTRHCDIYSFRNPTTSSDELCYFDVTAFFGRGDLTSFNPRQDLPTPGKPVSATELIGFEVLAQSIGMSGEAARDEAVLEQPIVMMPYSSDMVSQRIATLFAAPRELEVTPLRRYDEHDVPVLHSFNFYRLFILHALSHVLHVHNPASTETPLRADYYKPVLGTDCTAFQPLPSFGFANDYVNYTFWQHRPEAFREKKEVFAFRSSAKYAIGTGLMSKDELLQALKAAKPDTATFDTLSAAVSR